MYYNGLYSNNSVQTVLKVKTTDIITIFIGNILYNTEFAVCTQVSNNNNYINKYI